MKVPAPRVSSLLMVTTLARGGRSAILRVAPVSRFVHQSSETGLSPAERLL